MKTALGVIIFSVGLIMTVYAGFNYISNENLVNIGTSGLTKGSDHMVYWQPYVGFGIMALGGAILTIGRSKSLAHP